MRIENLNLYTSNIAEQKEFYCATLGFPLIYTENTKFQIQIGHTYLSFTYRGHVTPYHFAINIPSNKIDDAKAYLKKKRNIIKLNNNDILKFTDWNAKSLYFRDKDSNLLEFIARQNLHQISSARFNEKQVIGISEIGVPSENIEEIYQILKENNDLPIYDGDFTRFCAIGDEEGLFVCIDKGKKNWFPTNEEAFSSDFEILIRNNHQSTNYCFEGGKFFQHLLENDSQ